MPGRPDPLGHLHAHLPRRLQLRLRLGDDQRRQGHADDHLGQPRGHHLRHGAVGHQLDATATVPGTFTYTPAAGRSSMPARARPSRSPSRPPTPPITTPPPPRRRSTSTRPRHHHLGQSRGHHLRHGAVDHPARRDRFRTRHLHLHPGRGTVLHAGAGQALSVAFTPTDTTDYNSASASATINVDKATPTITWANPADITYGTVLSATQLDAATWPSASARGHLHLHPGRGQGPTPAPARPSRSPSRPPTPPITTPPPPPRRSMSTRPRRPSTSPIPAASSTAPRSRPPSP